MQNKFSRSYISSSHLCAPTTNPQSNRRNSSTMCVFDQSPDNMNSLWLRHGEEHAESILYSLLNAPMQQKKESSPLRESRMDSLKAACVPLFNSVRNFFRRNITPLTNNTTPKDCTTDFSNSSVYMGLVTTLPMANTKEKSPGNVPRSDLIDLKNFTLIHSMDSTDEKKKFTPPWEETPPMRKITKSDLNVCPEPSPKPPSPTTPSTDNKADTKAPMKRHKGKKSQNTLHPKGKKGKHKREKMRKNVFWDIRDDLNSEDDFEDEYEDVLCTEISSSMDEKSASFSPHTSDYVSDFIASIPSSQPSRVSPCTSFVKKLPSVLCMDIPFSPKRRTLTCKRSPDYDSDDSFIVFGYDSPKNTPESGSSTSSACDRVLKLTTCPKTNNLSRFDRRRSASEDSEDSFVIFTDGVCDLDESDNECLDDSSDSEKSCSSDSEDDENESYPKQLDSGFEERKVRFNLKPEVHVICAWNFAYRQARKGTWDQVARDRDRFEKRILSLEHVLKPVLQRDHREKMYRERFQADEKSF
ncbi:hypothetical protein DMENIID0001_078520 [Sergentomyia squamirostris]